MVLNAAGEMILATWNDLPQRFPNIELDEFVIMPNHIHGIITMGECRTKTIHEGAFTSKNLNDDQPQTNNVGAPLVGAHEQQNSTLHKEPAPTIGAIVGAFKSITTQKYINGVKQSGWPSFKEKLWQRNYYEHIVRNDQDYKNISEYIAANPQQWETDREHPSFWPKS